MNVAKLRDAEAYATRYGTSAGCVIRHGKLTYRWGNFNEPMLINSATKSWGSVLLGFAFDDGRLALHHKVQQYLPNLGAKPSSNVGKGWLDDITFAMLATHTAGFGEPSTYSALVAPPRTKYVYSDSGTNWLANAVTNIFRRDLRGS